jgi:hypothetical protein
VFKLQGLTSEQTPNFAMDTSDIDANAGGGEERYTTQLFDPDDSDIPLLNVKIQVPPGTSNWPPASLFEAVFANAVVRHFHTKNNNDEFLEVLKKWDGMFYPASGFMTTERASGKRRYDHDAEESTVYKKRKEDRAQRAKKHAQDDWSGDDVFDYLRILAMGPEKTKKYLEECEEIAAAAKYKENEERINAWRGGLTGDLSLPSVVMLS